MSAIGEVSTLLQGVGNVAVAASLLFLYRQNKLLQQQTDEARQLAETESALARGQAMSQNIFSAVDYLERPDHLVARGRIPSLRQVDFANWSTQDKTAADTVARVFQVVSTFQLSGALPEHWLHRQYGGAMLRAWDTLAEYIEDLRSRSDQHQRIDFERVCTEIRELGWFASGAGPLPPTGRLDQ